MKPRLSAKLKLLDKKIDNNPAALAAKVEIRENVLAAIGADRASVFDAFAGEGQLHRRVWIRANLYVGCDLLWFRDDRLMYVADSRRVLRAVELDQFNIFDFDAYGSPWEHAIILCARRQVAPGERIGLVLTEGSLLKIKMGGMPLALGLLSRLPLRMAGTGRARTQVLNRALAEICRRLNCRVIKRWEAKGRTGAAMIYFGLVLEGLGEVEKKAARPEGVAASRRRRQVPESEDISGIEASTSRLSASYSRAT